MTEPSYKLTEYEAIALYHKGILDIAATIYFLMQINARDGQVSIYQDLVCDRLGISNDEFNDAIIKIYAACGEVA